METSFPKISAFVNRQKDKQCCDPPLVEKLSMVRPGVYELTQDGNNRPTGSLYYINSNIRPGKKNVLILVIGRVDFDANKKNAGRKIYMTPRKIPSPEFSSLVNHGICGHLCADMNVLGLQVHLLYILVYFCAMTLILIQVESGSLVL